MLLSEHMLATHEVAYPPAFNSRLPKYVVMALYYIYLFHFLVSTLWRLCGMQSEKYELYPKSTWEKFPNECLWKEPIIITHQNLSMKAR